MVSTPGFDPNALRDQGRSEQLNQDPDSPLLNRATQARYTPGSTFKVVTAIAAIDSGRFEPGSTVNGKTGQRFSGVPLSNFQGADFGPVDLTTALTNSINTAWANVAEELGKDTMAKYMERLGFGADPPLDYPDGQMAPSGPYRGGKPISPRSRYVDVARMAIGQDRLQVTPLQMAMVASAVANDGELMEPTFTERVVDADGRLDAELDPEPMSRRHEPRVRRQGARHDGQRRPRGLRHGRRAAGHRGRRQDRHRRGRGEACPNQAWFIGFAPLRDPKVAVAATVECTDGTGGVVAAPIAKAVMESVLR